MSTPITPSKKVASTLSGLDLNTPTKQKAIKPASSSDDKENTVPDLKAIAAKAEPTKAQKEALEEVEASNGLAREQEEPLLKDNPRRFVLFPIQYNEVSLRLWVLDALLTRFLLHLLLRLALLFF